MSLREKIRDNKQLGKNILIFFGVFFLFFGLVNVSYAWKNLSVFVFRHTEVTSVSSTLKLAAMKPDMLSIPSLQISAPVVYVTEKGESKYQAALANGVVHYPGTALPGEFGNVYIFGHSSDLPWSTGQYKTIFAPLTQIAIGDRVYLTDHFGKEFVYEVFETKVVTPNDLSVVSQYGQTERLLSLQTSYPLGTALKRFIVLAKLVED